MVDQFNGWSWCFPAGFWSGHWRPGWDRCARAFARIFHSAGGGEGGTAETQGGHGPEGLHGLPLLAGWCLGMGLMFFWLSSYDVLFSVRFKKSTSSKVCDQTRPFSFRTASKKRWELHTLLAGRGCQKPKLRAGWWVEDRGLRKPFLCLIQFTYKSLPSFVSSTFMMCWPYDPIWSMVLYDPLWSWCTELAAWWRLRQVVASDWQEANLRTKIKSIISESKAAIVDEDEEEASIAWRFRLQSASFHAPKGCCHGEHRNNTSNSLGSSSLGFERLRPIHIWLQVHTFDISAFTKIKYVYSKGEWRENTTIFQSHGFLLIFHSTNPFQPPASINLPYCRMSQTKSLESRSWSLRCHPRGPATLKV